MFDLLKNKINARLNQTNIISYALGFVVLWFGISEIIKPTDWIGFAPVFLGTGALVYAAVIIHGILLTISGLMLVFNFYRRVAAFVLVLIFTEIIIDLIIGSIASDIIIRDIGLWGMALALLFK